MMATLYRVEWNLPDGERPALISYEHDRDDALLTLRTFVAGCLEHGRLPNGDGPVIAAIPLGGKGKQHGGLKRDDKVRTWMLKLDGGGPAFARVRAVEDGQEVG